MKLKLKLFVHGVPKGQKIWGLQEDDHIYVESFYGRKTNVDVQLLIETIQINKNVNCYYTYFRKGNIFDKDNRAGAYFAFTVRSNAYYTDIANMFNILEAAYQKMILGTILQLDASSTRFVVQNFDEVDKQLQVVEKEIINYLEIFSVESDFIDLNGFAANPKLETASVNILECNSKDLLTHVKKTGNLSVSPLHPTNQVVELTKRKNEEIENNRSQSQQQIKEMQNKAALEIHTAKKEKDDAINAIKTEYSSAHKTITDLKNINISLQTQLETEERSVSALDGELEKCKKELKDYKSIKKDFDSKLQEFERVYKILFDVKQTLSGLSGLSEILGVNFYQAPIIKGKPKKTRWLDKLNKFHGLLNLILILMLIVAIAFTLNKGTFTPNEKEQDIVNNKIEQLQSDLKKVNNHLKETQEQLKNAKSQLNNYTVESKELISTESMTTTNEGSNVWIDIVEFTKDNKTMKIGQLYHVSIKNVTGGEWKSNDFQFNGNEIKPQKTGDCTINYVKNGVVIKSRKVKVIN